MNNIATTQPKNRDWDTIIAFTILVSMPITIPLANKGFDALSDVMAKASRDSIVGQCVDLSPMPQGKAVDFIQEGRQVKVIQTGAGGQQTVTFMDFRTAQKLKAPCREQG
jgi:hypothetical protein